MAEQLAFLYDAASSLRGKDGSLGTLGILRSYYLMRCKAIGNKGLSLPIQQFGARKMCVHCCTEWNRDGYHTTVLPLRKLSKSARRRLRQNVKRNKKDASKKINEKMRSNSLERQCNFCGHKTIIKTLKPASLRSEFTLPVLKSNSILQKPSAQVQVKKEVKRSSEKKEKALQKSEINIYSDSKSVFTVKNEKKKQPQEHTAKRKPLRKKDKFAGLCKDAVLASAKAKQTTSNLDNKLNLFLRPSL